MSTYTHSFSDPLNGRVLQNVEKYEKLLASIPSKSLRGMGLKRPTSNYLKTRETYERLCQTQGSQVFISVSENGCKLQKLHLLLGTL